LDERRRAAEDEARLLVTAKSEPLPSWQHRAGLLIATVLCIGIAVALGLERDSVWVALVAALLLGVSLRRPQWGALLLLALAVPDLVATVEVGRFTLRAAQLVAAGTALGVAVELRQRGALLSTLRRIPIALWCFVAFIALALARLALLGAPNPVKGYAYAGWGLFVALAIAGSLFVVLDTRPRLARALAVFTGAIALLALFGLLQWSIGVLGGSPPLLAQWVGSMPRINGLSYEPSYFAFSTAIGCALALCALLGSASFLAPALAAAAAALTACALLLSSSRSGWIGLALLALLVVVLAVVRRRQLRRSQWIGLGAVLASLVLAGALMVTMHPADYAEMANRAMDVSEPTSSKPRLEGVWQALSMFRARPLLGAGLGQFGGTLSAEQARDLPVQQIDQIVTFNLYIELLAENGLLGCALVVCGLMLCARGAWRSWRQRDPELATMALAVLVAGGLAFAVMYQFNQTLFRTEVWCVLGLALALDRVRGATPEEGPS